MRLTLALPAAAAAALIAGSALAQSSPDTASPHPDSMSSQSDMSGTMSGDGSMKSMDSMSAGDHQMSSGDHMQDHKMDGHHMKDARKPKKPKSSDSMSSSNPG